ASPASRAVRSAPDHVATCSVALAQQPDRWRRYRPARRPSRSCRAADGARFGWRAFSDRRVHPGGGTHLADQPGRNADSASSHAPPDPLRRPGAYPHPGDDLQLPETHSSWVILAGPSGYNVKKPVNLGFLNFSDVEWRATDCADEVRLNRRLCPDVYLGVCWL